MTDISFQGATLTFQGAFESFTLNDLSDSGTPIEFAPVETIGIERDLNGYLVERTKLITPEFSLDVIPGSKSDSLFREWLLGCRVDADKLTYYAPTNLAIESAILTLANGTEYKFVEGYVVGGTSAIGANGEGRMQSGRFRFVWRDVVSGSEGFGAGAYAQTVISIGGMPLDEFFYATANVQASARTIAHPVETGSMIFDQKYTEPRRVTVRAKVPLSVAERTEWYFATALADRSLNGQSRNKTGYAVYMKSGSYENLTLVRVSHSETPDAFDLLDYNLEFQELLTTKSEAEAVPVDSSDQNRTRTVNKTPQSNRPTD